MKIYIPIEAGKEIKLPFSIKVLDKPREVMINGEYKFLIEAEVLPLSELNKN